MGLPKGATSCTVFGIGKPSLRSPLCCLPRPPSHLPSLPFGRVSHFNCLTFGFLIFQLDRNNFCFSELLEGFSEKNGGDHAVMGIEHNRNAMQGVAGVVKYRYILKHQLRVTSNQYYLSKISKLPLPQDLEMWPKY